MWIHGLQKMTLLDFPGHVACTVFLGGCDWRCPFCHNYDLACGRVKPQMKEEDLLAFLKKRQGLLDGVAFTGGEPCLHQELPALLEKIRDLGFAVKLDSNGCHPEMLEGLFAKGLVDYAAMDLKNSPEKYARTCGVAEVDMARIGESIRIIRERAPDYEFRTTIVQELHEDHDLVQMGEMMEGAHRYFLQSFTDRDSVPFQGFHAPPVKDLERFAQIAAQYVKEVGLRGV